MNFAVLQFPASNCDQDAVHVLKNVLGHSARLLWHKQTSLGGADADQHLVECRGVHHQRLGRAVIEHQVAPWHFLYFLPLPHGQGSLRPTFLP